MSLSSAFIRRPVATALFIVAIVLLGGTAYTMLPVAALSNVSFPTISVTAQLPGADPKTMASSVATPLEKQFGQIPYLTQMTSTSSLGYTSIILQFAERRHQRRRAARAGSHQRRIRPIAEGHADAAGLP